MAGAPLAASARNTLGNTTTLADPLDPSALAVTVVLPAPDVSSIAVAGPDDVIAPSAALELVQSNTASVSGTPLDPMALAVNRSVSPLTRVSGVGATTTDATAATATMLADAD